MGETNGLPPGQSMGGEWWQQLLSYGVGRAVDYEYLQPFALSNDQVYGRGKDGTIYYAGQRSKPGMVPGMSNSVLVLGAGAVLLMFLLLKD